MKTLRAAQTIVAILALCACPAWGQTNSPPPALETQRTRAYQTDREIQGGFLVGLAYKAVSVTAFVFNPDESSPTLVLAAGLTF